MPRFDAVDEGANNRELIGTTLDDRYQVIEALGHGAMGSVFRGEHTIVGRQVAIKVLHGAGRDDAEFRLRFEREALAAGRLHHPNCVPVTDSGQLPDGGAYLVMEFVDGEGLGDLLKAQGAIEPLRALAILRHVLSGLAHAHKAGVVHRDIKPDNIMVCDRDGDDTFARILDFGIAKIRDSEAEGSENLTQGGIALGTPSYLSPEQALGDSIDHRSDLYSCAVLLFELLTGTQPFRAESSMGVLTKHASEAPPHLADRKPELARWPLLDQLCQRGMAKAREQRFQSAGDFIAAIDGVSAALHAEAIASVPGMASPPRRLAKKKRRVWNPKRLLAMGAVAFIVVGITVALQPDKKERAKYQAALFDGYVEQLETAKTCEERRKAVQGLAMVGDPRAIPILKKARRRMRGGVLGIGASNANQCLREDAEAAIRLLEKNSE